MIETKFIITKDRKHFKSDTFHHLEIAREYNYKKLDDILETGLIIGNKIFILECQDQRHLIKHTRQYIGNVLYKLNPNCFDIQLKQWLKARELESHYYYSKRPINALPEGD